MRGGWIGAVIVGAVMSAAPCWAADWQVGAGADWQKVLAAARQEGTVVVAGAGQLSQAMSEAFKRDTGISIDWLTADPRELDARLGREMRAHSVTIDVFFTGAGLLQQAHAGLLMPVKPQLLLPGVADAKNWNDDQLKWIDNDQKFFLIPNEYVFSWPLYDGDVIKPGQIKTWKDLLKPEYKGKMAAYDPRSPGAGQAAAAYLTDLYGIEFVKQLYVGQDMMMASNSRQLVEWVARGTYPIGISALPPDIESFKKNGMNLDVGEMSDGAGSLLGGSSIVSEPVGAPHPNAATVFLNWYLSEPGQEIFAAIWQTPSRRADVKVATVPDYTIPKPGRTYLDQYREDWYVNIRPKLQAEIIDALGGH